MRYLFLLVILLFSACQDIKKPEKPENLISREKMVDIYVDAYLSNAARSIDNRVILDKGVKLDSFIYTKHKIDSAQFAKSNAYYTIDLSKYAEIFTEVEQRLVAMEKGDGEDNEAEETEEGIDTTLTEPQQSLIAPQASEALDSIE